MRGRLVGVIGLDGSGKTTLAKNLVEELRRVGKRAAYLHFWPSLLSRSARKGLKNSTGGLPKDLPLWKACALFGITIFMAWFRLHPLLQKNDYVICDRYLYDVAIYLELRGHRAVARRLLLGLRPDLILWLKVDPELTQTRKELEYSREVYRVWAIKYEELFQELIERKLNITLINANISSEESFHQAQEALRRNQGN